MLQYDPTPWFISQEGLTAVRGRRILGLKHPGDELAIQTFVGRYADSQCDDGSFEHSPLKTAGTLNCLDDLYTINANAIIAAGAAYLFSVLQSQPGYKLTHDVVPGSLTTPCDLCGFDNRCASRC